MKIILNITEDSNVELVKDNCEAVQGERNVTILEINWPSTIKGYSINNYTKQIEFGECKELGECVKFFDVLEGNTYKLCDICTQFEKIMIQFTLKNLVDEAEPIIWKSKPFALEFCKSINAENTKEAQVALLSLADILAEWENYIKANTFRVVSKVGDIPTADATNLGNVIFYLSANTTSPYALTYGHYYKCNYVNSVYEWTDLTQDPSIEGVANGIREINHNQTMQEWVGTKEELANEITQSNVKYIPIDLDIKETFDEVLSEMAVDTNYRLAYPIKKENGVLKLGDIIIPQKKLLKGTTVSVSTATSGYTAIYNETSSLMDRIFEIEFEAVDGYTGRTRIKIVAGEQASYQIIRAFDNGTMVIGLFNTGGDGVPTTQIGVKLLVVGGTLTSARTVNFTKIYEIYE